MISMGAIIGYCASIYNLKSEMLKLFKEDEECVFFNDSQDLIEKIGFYLKNTELREKIAHNGYKRAVNSGYDVIGRAQHILESYKIQ